MLFANRMRPPTRKSRGESEDRGRGRLFESPSQGWRNRSLDRFVFVIDSERNGSSEGYVVSLDYNIHIFAGIDKSVGHGKTAGRAGGDGAISSGGYGSGGAIWLLASTPRPAILEDKLPRMAPSPSMTPRISTCSQTPWGGTGFPIMSEGSEEVISWSRWICPKPVSPWRPGRVPLGR